MPVATMSVSAIEHKAETFHGVNRNDLAYRMVSKMGWAEGQGLGKDNHGITKHLWTKKRSDNVGLGGETSNDWGAHSMQTNVYNNLLSKLDVIVNNDSDSSSSSEDEDDKQKKVKKEAKKKESKKASPKKAKVEESSESSDNDSSSDDDVEGKAASSSTDAHANRKAGRSYAAAAVMSQRYAYKRAFLNKTKDVKSYSSSDLSQILGYSVPPNEEDQSLIAKDSIAQYSRPAKQEDKKAKKKSKSKSCSSDGSSSDSDEPVEPAKQRPAVPLPLQSKLTGALAHMFAAGGFLGSKLEIEDKKQDWIFDEATQEMIAVTAHESKVVSKQGLGFGSDRPSKLGKDYAGSKKTFGSDDESDSDEKSDDKAPKEARKSEKKAAKKAAKKLAKEQQGREPEAEDTSSKKRKKDKKRKENKSQDSEEDREGDSKKKKKIKHAKSFPEPEGHEPKKKIKKMKSYP